MVFLQRYINVVEIVRKGTLTLSFGNFVYFVLLVYIEKNAKIDPLQSEPLTSKNTQCYHCLTPKSASLIYLYMGGQFHSDEEGSICPIIPRQLLKTETSLNLPKKKIKLRQNLRFQLYHPFIGNRCINHNLWIMANKPKTMQHRIQLCQCVLLCTGCFTFYFHQQATCLSMLVLLQNSYS